MIRPDKGKFPITQNFGANPGPLYGPGGHDGIDIGAPIGSDVFAPRSGTVTDVNNSPAYGLRVKIDNGENIDYMGHLSTSLVQKGDKVQEGQLIAKSGASGNVTGPHIHWGKYTRQGAPLNPLQANSNDTQGQGESMASEAEVADLRRWKEIGMDAVKYKDAVVNSNAWNSDMAQSTGKITPVINDLIQFKKDHQALDDSQKKLQAIRAILG